MNPIDVPAVRRLLLIKPSSLGDIVHALPTFQAVRRRFPEAEISWLVKAQWAGILERVEGLQRIWRVGSSLSEWLCEIGRLREHRFDLVIDLQGLFRSGAAAWLTGCGTRIGFANAREGSPLCYTHRVVAPSPEMHAVDRYLLVARALGCAAALPMFPLMPTEADRELVRTLLARVGISRNDRWVAMHVSARWTTKRWPLDSFATVAERLTREGLPVVLIGAATEQEDARQVAARSGAADLSGQTSLPALPALLQAASCLVTNDSGPMHVAAAMGTPVVALFGPTSAVRTGPYGERHRVLSVPLACRPCFSRTCRNSVSMECLTSLSPEQAVLAIRQAVGTQASVAST